ncbi:nitroreductase/quinone reductase family protein [Nocardia jinanensis]|uniref:Nitroreductase family deazaflavin-dependent oxidoreductase n=1 Tax=Nocardia jinanensis TaxID=382504 RepID=A0A917RYW4_9NOCA|nr:nitroreductase/quinone reductase family protein [Nocardia jinanensis]GGL46503.1 hypothetical protein GCM10011588_71690 [Nocardia jinanensis]
MDTRYRQPFNKIIIGLQRLGVVFGPMQVLTVPGRRSGQPRIFPLAVSELTTGRYIIQAYPKAAWVANVRAAETVTLSRGRRAVTARLVDLPVEQRRPVLRELIEKSPASVAERLVATGLAEKATSASVVAAAHRIAVFRVEIIR